MPLTLVEGHLNRHPLPDWVHQPVYLNLYPNDLILHNHVQAKGLMQFRLGDV